MKYILDTLEIIDAVGKELNLEVDDNSKYKSLVADINRLSRVDISVRFSTDLRTSIIKYLKSLEIEKEYDLLVKIGGCNESFESLTDKQLLRYLEIVLRTVTYVQRDNLLLMKYSKNIWNTGWHNLAKQCRGKVIDLNTHRYVVYPFNKFFNLNEVSETNLDRVNAILSNAKYISITDKKDGSIIIITKYNGNIIINTNGEFENIQIDLAKELLKNKYCYFYNNIPDGYTFMFELIHPKNRIVLDYGSEKKLYLLGVRDLAALRLLKYSELLEVADKYNLDITESVEFSSLDEFIKIAQGTDMIKEGWVFRVIGTEGDSEVELMFKLKYQEYFRLSSIKSVPSLKKVYNLLQTNKLDDIVSAAESETRKSIEESTKVIFEYIDKFKDIVIQEVNRVKEEYSIKDNLPKETIIAVLDEFKGNPFTSYIMRVLKGNCDVDSLFDTLPKTVEFGNLYKYYNTLKNIDAIEWDVE